VNYREFRENFDWILERIWREFLREHLREFGENIERIWREYGENLKRIWREYGENL